MNPSPTIQRAKKYAGIYLAVILFIVSFGSGLMIGRIWFVQKEITNDQGIVEINKVVNLNRSLNKSDSVDFKQFWTIWDKIKKKYVKQPVDEVDMFYGALQGLVMSLGDPYSVYLPPKSASEFTKDLSGELEGIGAEIGIKNNQLTVISPLPDSPAEKAGLLPGDKILAVNNTSTFGMSIGFAVSKIKGKAGTTVVLSVSREGLNEVKEISIVRAKINVPAILFSIKKGNIAYLRIMQFNESTDYYFDKYIKELKNNSVKGIILDLRNNPGGFLKSAVSMASEWVKDGVVVKEKGVNGSSGRDFETIGKHQLDGIKTVVLVNRGSASASEIVAGALQDYNKAVIMGEKTFGKGSVQDFEILKDGSAIKLTVAEWFTPNGKNINKSGIMPDIEVKIDWKTQKVGEDEMLDKALGLFTSSTFQFPQPVSM